MGYWLLGTVVAVVMLLVVAVALWAGRREDGPEPAVPEEPLPDPDRLAAPRFPLAWQGYRPDHVDAWVGASHRAYAELWRVLEPEERAELTRRVVARREGRDPAADLHAPEPEPLWEEHPAPERTGGPIVIPKVRAPREDPGPREDPAAGEDPPPRDG